MDKLLGIALILGSVYFLNGCQVIDTTTEISALDQFERSPFVYECLVDGHAEGQLHQDCEQRLDNLGAAVGFTTSAGKPIDLYEQSEFAQQCTDSDWLISYSPYCREWWVTVESALLN